MSSLEELSDYDFEQLAADLLSADWKVGVQTFPRGPDGGVDLRVLGPAGPPLNLGVGEEIVVQCKHRPNSVLAGLRSDLRMEAAKPVVNEATRYVLVTSARLTRKNKKEVVALFGNRIAECDVLGREDIVALLRRHPEVERANIKLWLTSAGVLQALLNQKEYLRSAALGSDLQRLRCTFVETSTLRKARQVLEQLGVCVLAGPPGVGKTTTASILLLQYMAEGWQPIAAIAEVRELEAQFQPNIRQVLFFDDFLGQNSLETKLGRGEDSELVRLIHAVERDPNKIFILTTRDYVLQQAKQSYEKLGDELLKSAKITVNVEGITPSERAHILYNQLYFSPLRSQAAAAPDGPRRYKELTRHSNYNPRLIEAGLSAAVRELGLARGRQSDERPPAGAGRSWRTGVSDIHTRNEDSSALDVPNVLRQALDNPASLWDHVLRHQLNALQRDLLLTRLSLGPQSVYLTDLIEAASLFASTPNHRPTTPDIDAALRVLDGDLLTVTGTEYGRRAARVGFLKPGVADALLDFLSRYPDELIRLATSAAFFEQIRWITEIVDIANDRHNMLFSESIRHELDPIDQQLVHRLVRSAERTLVCPN